MQPTPPPVAFRFATSSGFAIFLRDNVRETDYNLPERPDVS